MLSEKELGLLEKEILATKMKYDKARTSYEASRQRKEELLKEMKALGVNIDTIEGEFNALEARIKKKEAAIMKIIDEARKALVKS